MFHLLIQHELTNAPACDRLGHPMLEVLESVYKAGSIVKAAKLLGRSYRHVWGELKHWETELNANLIVWGRSGKGAKLTPQAIAFLSAVSQVQIDLAPQLAQIKNRFQQCITVLKSTDVVHENTH